jgi:hypothetical protein
VGTQISQWRSRARRFLSRNGQLHCADYLGLLLSDNWHNNIVIGIIAVVTAIQNMFIWITGAWLY